jgi:protoheme IX farnesyltransferase
VISRGDVVRDGASAVVTLVASRRRLADFVSLTKPRVVVMIVLTALTGYYLGQRGEPDYLRLVHALVGIALAAGGALALNQVMERDLDARMARTRSRPLPDGRLQPAEAVVFGGVLTLGGLVQLALAVGPACATVTAVTSALYLGVYTPLKRVSPLCTVLGAVPGVLFTILFLWQLPHTLAIARLYRDDYARAGIRVLPVVDPDGGSTERQIVAGCLALHAAALLPTLVGLTGGVYFFGALLLGALFLVLGIAQALRPSPASARRLMHASMAYLPLLLGLMALDKVG